MTPQERELVADLFARLAELEREPRDPDAERAIRQGLARAPNALYALVQTVLLQDEGLRAADDRIAELEDTLAQMEADQPRSRSFLSGRREGGKWNTGEVLRGSVPQVRPGDQPMGAPPIGDPGGYGDRPADEPRGRMPWTMRSGAGPGEEAPRGGGGFLGTAAAVAAGAIGGGLLMSGIKSALAGQGDEKSPFAGALEQLTGKKAGDGAGESSGANELGRDAGLEDISGARRTSAADLREQDAAQDQSGDDDYEDDGGVFEDDVE